MKQQNFSVGRLKGFTLTEVFVVIVVIGVIAAIALPNFTGQKHRICNQEGEIILRSILGSQNEFFGENGAYTTNLNDLSVTFDAPAESNCWASWEAKNEVPAGETRTVGQTNAKDGSYSLVIKESGRIFCNPAGSVCDRFRYGDPAGDTGASPPSGGGC